MKLKTSLKNSQKEVKKYFKNTFAIIRNNLFATLGILFTILLLLIVGANFLRNNNDQQNQEKPPIAVDTYQIGSVPKVELIGKAEKANVITITAQTTGVIQSIYVNAGDYVTKGRNLAYISTNYQGANATSIQRQIAEKQYQNVKQTYQEQLDLINKQKEIAKKTEENSQELREINQDSVDETKDLIELNQDVISYLDENIDWYEATNSADRNRSLIAQTQQLKTNYQSALNQLKSSLRQLEYNTDSNNPPAELADLQKETTLKQLDLQKKSLQLNKEISHLQYQLATVNESLSFPASFTEGVIQKVHVKKGQLVNPGMPLFTINGTGKTTIIRLSAPKKIAKNISNLEKSEIILKNTSIKLLPDFISTEATDGTLYNIKYTLPEAYNQKITNQENIIVKVPVGYPETGTTIPFIPIDAVYQTNGDSFVYLIEDKHARVRSIELGQVYGRFVAVENGLNGSNQIILNRNVVDGDKILVNQ
jgi:multidrug efflux pump subunit AcrA (membrane-fusion protein)